MLAAHFSHDAMVELLLSAGALGSAYHKPTAANKVDLTAGEAEVAANTRGIEVEDSGIERTLTLDTPLSLMRRGLRGGF